MNYHKKNIPLHPLKKKPRSYKETPLRWLALILACLLLFGDAYSFDNPQALESHIETDLEISHTSFNLLYSVYSFPNMLIPIFGGIIIDFLGVRVAIFLFSTLLIIGQLIVSYGGYIKIFWLMILGRIIFGIGSESLTVSQTSIVSIWFRNKELAFALSLNFSLPKLGSSLNSLLTPRFYNCYSELSFPLLIGSIICVLSWFCGILLCQLDLKNDKREGKKITSIMAKINLMRSHKSTVQVSSLNEILLKKALVSNLEIPKMKHAHSQQLEMSISDAEIKSLTSLKSDLEDEKIESVEKITFADIKNLSFSFWILMSICMLTEGLFIPFLDNANNFYQIRFGFDSVSAGNILIIPYVLSSILSPLIGILIDRIGKRSKFIIFTAFFFFITHVIFATLPNSNEINYISIIPLISLGICYSLYAAVIMPSLPLVVDNKIIGTAFGLVGIFQNSALGIFPVIVGGIFDNFSNEIEDQRTAFFYSSLFFSTISFLVFCISIGLEILDRATGKTLDKIYINTVKENKKNEIIDNEKSYNSMNEYDSKHCNNTNGGL